MLVLREQGVPLLQEDDELLGHLVQLAHVGVRVGVAEAGADGVVDEQDVGELVPGALVVHQGLVVLQPVGADLHQGAVLGAAAGPAVQPYHRALLIRDVFVLEVPKEEVAIVFGGDLDVSLAREHRVSLAVSEEREEEEEEEAYPACIFTSGPSGAPGRERTK